MNWLLRSALTSDAPTFEQLFLSHLPQLVPDANSPARQRLALQHTEAQFRQRLQQDWLGLVAEQEGAVCGFLMLRRPAHLFSVYVDLAKTGKGVGASLLNALITRMPQTIITVNASLAAEGFYRRHGFVATDEWQFSDGLHYLPMQRLPG